MTRFLTFGQVTLDPESSYLSIYIFYFIFPTSGQKVVVLKVSHLKMVILLVHMKATVTPGPDEII